MRMSAVGMRAWTRATPRADLRSTAMEVLRRVRRSAVEGAGVEVVVWCDAGWARSMRMTVAP